MSSQLGSTVAVAFLVIASSIDQKVYFLALSCFFFGLLVRDLIRTRRYSQCHFLVLSFFIPIAIVSSVFYGLYISALQGIFVIYIAISLARAASSHGFDSRILLISLTLVSLPIVSGQARYSGIFENSNAFASSIIGLFLLALTDKRFKPWIGLCFSALLIFLTFLSASRAWLVVALLLFIFSLYFTSKRVTLVLVSSLSVLLTGEYDYSSVTEAPYVLVARFTELGSDGSSDARLTNILIGLDLFFGNPLGYGLNGFYAVSGQEMHSHSSILEILISFGAILGFLFCTLVFRPLIFFLISLRAMDDSQKLFGFSLCTVTILYLFADNMFSSLVYLCSLFYSFYWMNNSKAEKRKYFFASR